MALGFERNTDKVMWLVELISSIFLAAGQVVDHIGLALSGEGDQIEVLQSLEKTRNGSGGGQFVTAAQRLQRNGRNADGPCVPD